MEITEAATTPVVAAGRLPDHSEGSRRRAPGRTVGRWYRQPCPCRYISQDEPHEGEEGDSQQGFVRHDPPHSLRQGLKQGRAEGVGSRLQGVRSPDPQRPGRRPPGSQQQGQDRVPNVGAMLAIRKAVDGPASPPGRVRAMSSANSSSAVLPRSSVPGSGPWPARKATRLMNSETPCRASRAKPRGISSRAGQTTRPPALEETS